MPKNVHHLSSNTYRAHFEERVFSYQAHPDHPDWHQVADLSERRGALHTQPAARVGTLNTVNGIEPDPPRTPVVRAGEYPLAESHGQAPGVPDHGQDRTQTNPERPLQGFSTQTDSNPPERLDQRPRWGVRQDKGSRGRALRASRQPAPLQKASRAESSSNFSPRSQKRTREKLVHTTLWLSPLVRAELARLAELENLSVSQVGAALLGKAIRQDIHSQYNALIQPMIKQVIRDELSAFGNRLVFFLMRIAYASEQTRILVTNILSRVLKREGAPDKAFSTLLDQSNKMARRNILTKTPQLEELLEEWEGSREEAQGHDTKTTKHTQAEERSRWQL